MGWRYWYTDTRRAHLAQAMHYRKLIALGAVEYRADLKRQQDYLLATRRAYYEHKKAAWVAPQAA